MASIPRLSTGQSISVKTLAIAVIVLICLLAISASIFDVHCTAAHSGERAAFMVCGGRLP